MSKEAKSLVIVESPTKVRTIGHYLGDGYTLKATKGHVRDLPQDRFGVDVEHDFKPEYQILRGRSNVIKDLRSSAKSAEIVYLAMDPDREGEAIAWHVAQALKLPKKRIRRATFNEVTRAAVREAIDQPGSIDMNRVNAQQARRILDRIVGYELSPLLSKKVTRGLSAGRVQSVAVRLIAEREREISAFEAEEYWEIEAEVLPPATEGQEAVSFKLKLWGREGEEIRLGSEDDARKAMEEMRDSAFVVSAFQEKETRSNPSPPFNTSSMQQAASTKLRFSASKTMQIAQQLYEGVDVGPDGSTGLITYMRTDSLRVADQAVKAAREYVGKNLGGNYLPKKARSYKSPKSAQAAHEAIRPTNVDLKPDDLKQQLTRDQLRLYRLIWERFLASQMASAKYWSRSLDVEAGPYVLRARGRRLVFDGYLRLTPTDSDKEEQELPKLDAGAELKLVDLEPSQHFTQPPPRYTEASLVRTLEREGIGRPSTYASIISTIQKRNYVRQIKRAFHATDLGLTVTDMLVGHFPREMDVKFTARMEDSLDEIEAGKVEWLDVLKGFYSDFKDDLDAAASRMQRPEIPDELSDKATCEQCGKPMAVRFDPRGRMFLGCSDYPRCTNVVPVHPEEQEESEHSCPKCGKPLLIKVGRRNRKYFACSGYPECRNIMGMDSEGKPVEMERPEVTNVKCDKCGRPMVIRQSKRGRFLGCSGFPRCRGTKPMPEGGVEAVEQKSEGDEATDEAESDLGKCPDCGGNLVLRRGRRGRFLGCSNYPKCRYTASAKGVAPAEQPEATDEKCEKCGMPMVLRTGRNGKFLACSGYPECRNARPLETTGVPCPEEGCDGTLVERKGRGGRTFYGCSRYPDCKYTSASLPENADAEA